VVFKYERCKFITEFASETRLTFREVKGKSSVSCFFDSRCITVHETTNDSYESMQSGSHGAAIMLKTVCVVISNYSKLKNIENKSEDLIHCKMQ